MFRQRLDGYPIRIMNFMDFLSLFQGTSYLKSSGWGPSRVHLEYPLCCVGGVKIYILQYHLYQIEYCCMIRYLRSKSLMKNH